MLSIGGWSMLLKYVFVPLRIYYMSMFKMHVVVS